MTNEQIKQIAHKWGITPCSDDWLPERIEGAIKEATAQLQKELEELRGKLNRECENHDACRIQVEQLQAEKATIRTRSLRDAIAALDSLKHTEALGSALGYGIAVRAACQRIIESLIATPPSKAHDLPGPKEEKALADWVTYPSNAKKYVDALALELVDVESTPASGCEWKYSIDKHGTHWATACGKRHTHTPKPIECPHCGKPLPKK